MKKRITVGMDLGDRMSELCVLEARGAVVRRERVPTTQTAMRAAFEAMPRALVALEVGTHSPWISRLIKELGHEVVVAHPAKVPLIYHNVRKRDRADAEALARLVRMDRTLLSPVVHRGAQAQVDLQLLRSRDALVRARTQLVNHVRTAVKVNGERLPVCSAQAFANKVAEHIPPALSAALSPVLEMIASLTRTIGGYDKEIDEAAAQRYPETQLLRQVPGVGPITSLAFVLTLESAQRFAKSRDVGPYLGLIPKQRQSGDSEPHLRISKAGNGYLRSLLVGCAQYILGPFAPDTALRRWALAKAEHGGKNAKKRAVVALARKLAVLLHRLWSTGEIYRPFPNEPEIPLTKRPRPKTTAASTELTSA